MSVWCVWGAALRDFTRTSLYASVEFITEELPAFTKPDMRLPYPNKAIIEAPPCKLIPDIGPVIRENLRT